MRNINWSIIVIPLIFILLLSTLVIKIPEVSIIINQVKSFLTYDVGLWYLVFGLGFVIITLWIGLSRYGNVRLGSINKPKYSNFSWGTMIFTSTMAADILYYSFHEWMYYYKSINPILNREMNQSESIKWSITYPLFHWGITPWCIYILPAIAYSYMFYCKNDKNQKMSEACRPILGDNFIRGIGGKIIDQVSVIGLLLGVSTTFSVATPLITEILCNLLNINKSNSITVLILLIVSIVYTLFVMIGIKGISFLSKLCTILFGLLGFIIMISSNPKFVLESGFQGIGNLFQNFIILSTSTDPTNITKGFVQNYTMYYIAYWIAWAIATPLFIGKISEGRTIRNVAFGGLLSGLSGTFASFVIFGNSGLYQYLSKNIDVVDDLNSGAITTYKAIIKIIDSFNSSFIIKILIIIVMIGLYATTLDSIANVVSSYSYVDSSFDKDPSKLSKIYWSLLFIILPISLIKSNYLTSQLQAMSIIAAMPVSVILLIIVLGLIKQLKEDYK